ncbi:MAG: M24 family metallopeptidase [Candidatus Kariarchaeaceae archaeon]
MEFKFATPKNLLLDIVREKHDQLEDILVEVGIDCWIVFVRETSANPDPVQNLVIGGDVVWDSAFIFYKSGDRYEKIAIIGNFDADAEKNKGIWTEVIPYTEGISSVLSETVSGLSPSQIALNYSLDDVVSDGLSHGMFVKLSQILDESLFTPAVPIIQRLRARKTKTEVDLVTKACELTEVINETITRELATGMTEKQIQQRFHQLMNENGVIEAWQRDSCPAVDAGPDKVMGHVGPTDKYSTRSGHTLHNDFGVQLNGYSSDIQRMWFFGTEDQLPDELDHAFKTVHGAISRAADFIKPGVRGMDVDNVARSYVIERGYEEYKHALGHQVGMKAHDGGVILGPLWERYGDTPKGIIEEGNIFTLELYVKTENYGMVSLEEDIVITSEGCRFLVPRQEDWIYIN